MINWLDINYNTPELNKQYIVKYTEYIGSAPIYGFKLSKYIGSFQVSKNYTVTHFSEIPEYITNYENNHSRMQAYQ